MNDAERIKDLEERVDVLGKMVSNLLWAFNEHFHENDSVVPSYFKVKYKLKDTFVLERKSQK